MVSTSNSITSESKRSDVFIPMELGSGDATKNLAKATCQLWTAGSAAQHWLFHQLSRDRYQNLNLPPYQFDTSSHWIQYKPRSEPRAKEGPSLVTLMSNDDSSVTEAHMFAVDTSNAFYQLAAQGHAVTGQSLCPASMYVELAVRCVMEIQRTGVTITTETLPHVKGLTMLAPLGLGAGTAVFLRLHKTAPETWDFAVFSRSSSLVGPGHLGDRETEHAKGRINSIAANDAVTERLLKLLQRSGANRMQNLPSVTGVNGALVYKIFSEVVEYASYYRGVQSVSASGSEAVGLVTVPTDQPFAMHAHICDPISLDNFLQVAGIHVNCLSPRDDDQVFMCTAVDEVIFSASFMTSRGDSRAWSVYTRYESTSKVDISNDIYVYDASSRLLVLVIMGANFRSVPLRSVAS